MERSLLRLIPGVTFVLALDRECRKDFWSDAKTSAVWYPEDESMKPVVELKRVTHYLRDMPGRRD